MKTLIETTYPDDREGPFTIGYLDIPDNIECDLEEEAFLWKQENQGKDTQPGDFVTWLSMKYAWPEIPFDFNVICVEDL